MCPGEERLTRPTAHMPFSGPDSMPQIQGHPKPAPHQGPPAKSDQLLSSPLKRHVTRTSTRKNYAHEEDYPTKKHRRHHDTR